MTRMNKKPVFSMLVCGLVGCSAAPAGNEQLGKGSHDGSDQAVGRTAEPLGESSCATAPPDAEWEGEVPPPQDNCFTIPTGIGSGTTQICQADPSTNSPDHYSNP